jgi:hypothetical protein
MRLRLIAILIACVVVAAASSTATAETPRAPRAVLTTLGFGGDQASLQGTIYNHGTPAHFRFQWGPTKAYGHVAKNGADEREGNQQRVEATITVGLYETFCFRLIAFDAAGKWVTGGQCFPGPPR